MNASLNISMTLKESLEQAIRDNTFRLRYQPQVDLTSGWIKGAVVSLYWPAPDGEPIAHSALLSAAHDSEIAVELGEWMLRQACQQNYEWQQAGLPPIRVAVPIPAALFRVQDVAQRVGAILQQAQLHGRYLELDIAETVLLEDLTHADAALSALHALQVQSTVTDVRFRAQGDEHLATLPLDRIKLDGALVSPSAKARTGETLARLLVAHAHSTGLKIAVYGVNSFEQFKFFRHLECFEMVGNFYYRPIDGAMMSQLLNRESKPPLF
ncbi:EAL domain-containing protein [Mycetohabitans endofungorum]|uniref:EAL domain-containing protein n=1 Tax=Mycetohabitans endofungorum TaxID=417203 RepID=UPI002B054641|nr:EAL domain-containing protein [Mycetohabitans endofungorum]